MEYALAFAIMGVVAAGIVTALARLAQAAWWLALCARRRVWPLQAVDWLPPGLCSDGGDGSA